MTRRWLRWWPAALVVLLLAGGTGVAVAAAGGAFASRVEAPSRQCAVPSLPGTVVDVELADAGTMMGAGHDTGYGYGYGGMARSGHGASGGPGYGPAGGPAGMMRILLSGDTVPAGTVSLRVANVGSLVHELVVLPLAPGASAGERRVGSDDRVSEAGSLGEASTTCGEGAGSGIDPGASSWVTLHLPLGHYELVCNLPGHYAAGMYAELVVR